MFHPSLGEKRTKRGFTTRVLELEIICFMFFGIVLLAAPKVGDAFRQDSSG